MGDVEIGAARCPRLVGRDDELARLRAAVDEARYGRGSAVAVIGPPGIGKSRLIGELSGLGAEVLVGRAVPGAWTAHRPLIEVLATGLRGLPWPNRVTLDPYRAVLDRLLTAHVSSGESDDRVWVIAETLLRVLRAIRGDDPQVVVLEDLHWSDPDTLDVVEYVADNLARERCLLVLTAREEPGPVLVVLDRLARRAAVHTVRLGALSERSVLEMAAACLGGRPGNAVRDLLHRAHGTPLMIEELLASTDAGVDVPRTVVELTMARVRRLSVAARRCVFAAAVLGEGADPALLRGMLGLPIEEVGDAVREAAAADLVEVADADTVAFRHSLTRDAVLASMLPGERAGWATRALVVLDDIDADWRQFGGLAADLAEVAGDPHRAAALLVRAGRHDASRGALATAEAALRRAGALAEGDARRPPTRTKLSPMS
ncbi:ATP-binding protein [Actinomycetospora flava]|uniref:AAA family ATPase n=1 Tax=Actinomycetospora flava TaxID=3129232 RepID=A0ABU8M5F4_9PSEU